MNFVNVNGLIKNLLSQFGTSRCVAVIILINISSGRCSRGISGGGGWGHRGSLMIIEV